MLIVRMSFAFYVKIVCLLPCVACEIQTNRQTKKGIPHVNFSDGSESHAGRSLAVDLRDISRSAPGFVIHQMLVHLVLNHSVLVETVRDDAGQIIGTRLSASRLVLEWLCVFCSF